MNIIEKSSEANYLAAMAVFQQMFNQKKGMYDVICSFIEQYIVSKNVYDFLLEDILFHIAGYNGEFFKKQADDFLALLSEINRKEKIIHLFYFDKVKREVEHFFNNAEDIVSGKIISCVQGDFEPMLCREG